MVFVFSVSAVITDLPREEPKQTVLVYKQTADGGVSSTGQLIQLTPSQMLQLVAAQQQNKQQRPLSQGGATISVEDPGTSLIDVVPSVSAAEYVSQSRRI